MIHNTGFQSISLRCRQSHGRSCAFVIITLLIFFHFGYGQETGRLETDRPDQAECPFIVKTNHLQVEAGLNVNNESDGVSYFLPTHLVKFGLYPSMELRYQSTLRSYGGKLDYAFEAVGIKLKITEGGRAMPRLAVIAHYHFSGIRQDLSDLNRKYHSVGDVVLTAQNDIAGKFAVGYNFGAELHSDGGIEGIFRIAPGMNLGKRFTFYSEVFGRLPLGISEDIWMDCGVAYYVSEDLKLDFSAGRSIYKSKDTYWALGLSFRVNCSASTTPGN